VLCTTVQYYGSKGPKIYLPRGRHRSLDKQDVLGGEELGMVLVMN
jgi:hypothetical protein